LGIRQASGDYIALLDADDVWIPSKLEQQVPIMDAHPEVDMVYGTTLIWYSGNGTLPGSRQDYVADMGMPLEQVSSGRLLLTRMLSQQAKSPSMSNVLVRRAGIVRAGFFEEQFQGMHDDQVFLVKLCLRSRVFVSDKCWDKYRKHPDSCLARATALGQCHAARGRYLNWIRIYLAEQGERGSEVWGVVEEQLRPYGFPGRLQLRGRQATRATRRFTLNLARRILPRPFRAWLRGWSA
jgi:glycosyltransferase involved in cell wall biosynthesis